MSYHITFTTNQKEKKLNQNPVIILDLNEEELKTQLSIHLFHKNKL